MCVLTDDSKRMKSNLNFNFITVKRLSILFAMATLTIVGCKKETPTKSTHSVVFNRDGQKYQYFHNGVVLDTNAFTAQTGDSVRLYSAESLPQSHYAEIVVDGLIVASHSGYQDTTNLTYLIP